MLIVFSDYTDKLIIKGIMSLMSNSGFFKLYYGGEYAFYNGWNGIRDGY